MANRFVRSRPTTQWATGVTKSLGDRICSTSTTAYLGIHFECTTAGTTGGSEPTWNTTIGGTTADNTVTWTTRGSCRLWQANKSYALGDRCIPNPTGSTAAERGYVYECTTAGTSGGTEPATWVTTTPDTSTTTDNTVTWTCKLCDSWDDAHQILIWVFENTAGSGALAAGDTIYLSKNYSETYTSDTSFISVGTDVSPIKMLCVDDTGDPSSPTTLSTGAIIKASTGIADLFLTGGIYVYGVEFWGGSSNSDFNTVQIGYYGYNSYIVLDNCRLNLDTTSSSSFISFGCNYTGYRCHIHLLNTYTEFSNASQDLRLLNGDFIWENSSLTGTAPTTLFTAATGFDSSRALIRDVDLSLAAGSSTLVDITNTRHESFKFVDCRLHASVTKTSGSASGVGGTDVEFINCSSTSNNYESYKQNSCGTLVHETVLVMDSGATDGVTPISWKVTTTSNTNFVSPFLSFPILIRYDTIGYSKTATIEILHDSATNLKDDEIWIELSYLGSSSYPLGTAISDRKTDILATGADQATSTASWTTTGMSNPNTQKLEVTFTPNMKGLVSAVVCIAKASKTVYINPEIRIT